MSGWIGVDLDGTLAVYERGQDFAIGAVVPAMRERVLGWRDLGIEVRIFTARAAHPAQVEMVRGWLKANGFPPLEITNVKDFDLVELWDDRAIQVERNTGRRITENEPLRAHGRRELPFTFPKNRPGRNR